MKPVIRYRSQLLFRKSYKPDRNVPLLLQRLAVRGVNGRMLRAREVRPGDSNGGRPGPADLDLQE
ncbi:MAG TPA: hypothetical protein VNU95_12965 [Candidatus Acidoferrales bacterium]|nr:hypothetical protein [Candidatus Acidoferrales bacterium]